MTNEHKAALLAGQQARRDAIARDERRREKAERSRELAIQRDPRVKLFRKEKQRAQKRLSPVLAEAKAAYDAMLEAQREAMKGGRPAKAPRLNLRRDPVDALCDALGERWTG